jgi:hypothetical protein
MRLTEGMRLLRGRYELVRGPLTGVAEDERRDALSWEADGEYGAQFLVKTWAYEGDEPDRVQRALWDAELRTLYKVGSTPGADDTLTVLRDAALDRDAKCFVMVLEAPGYEPLEATLGDRRSQPWLANRDAGARRELWLALARLADGLRLLHEQQVLHRRVDAGAVLFDRVQGSESVRLGGFEWSVRLGAPAGEDPPVGWSTPPEALSASAEEWRPETDWFGFGMLAARLLLDVERHGNHPVRERHAYVFGAVQSSNRHLAEPERALLGQLIATDPLDRLNRYADIRALINEIVALLAAPVVTRDAAPVYTLVFDPRQYRLVEYLLEVGLREELELGAAETFNPGNPLHVSRACTFMQRDLTDALLYAVASQPFFILVGERLILRMGPHAARGQAPTWSAAWCHGPGELRSSDGGESFVALPSGRVVVRSAELVGRDRSVLQLATSWEPVLPVVDRGSRLARDLAWFHEFVRCTNQIELLLRDAEIFPYEIVDGPVVVGAIERITIRELPREPSRKVLRFFELEKGLVEFLQREQQAGKQDSGNVILSGPGEDALVLGRADQENQWKVEQADIADETVVLRRDAFDGGRPDPYPVGILRSAGMQGQTQLIRRRKAAIDALDSHSYLLRSLAAPGQVYMDTGQERLPVELDPSTVDEAKRAAIEDILRVRPIYTLQGPPGTGKTTLVAWLVRQILEDDPVAQILVTAQAHGAVDVLRARVRDEAFRDVPLDQQPLAVRLGFRGDDEVEAEDSVREVARRVLVRSVDRLKGAEFRERVQDEWLADAEEMVQALSLREFGESGSGDFEELVKRGANLTYCTTSAGELEALARDQSFDWSIVEEAGKAHGFDLALPLQAGHRWLLIGDHKQLPPYRFEDYRAGLDNLNDVVRALEALPNNASGLLDWEWTRTWRDRSPTEREQFRAFAIEWLKSFERAFTQCSTAVGGRDAGTLLTRGAPQGAAAGVLVGQHRMHPAIGDLISSTYYDGELVNNTQDVTKAPLARVVHGFSEPPVVQDRAIVWLDVPWCRDNPRTREHGPPEGRPRYTNPAEAVALRNFLLSLGPERDDELELAILSPYNQQTAVLRDALRGRQLPRGLRMKSSLHRHVESPAVAVAGVHTVDSFQGNQADVIAVSLVRNNTNAPAQGLGFLDEASRLNVLLSRAERLLILVGSWDFFTEQVSFVDLEDRNMPLWHLRQIVTILGDWFDQGTAARVPADLTGVRP